MKNISLTKLSMIGFLSLTIVMVMDVYEYPVFATSGLQLIFFLLIGGMLWFIPVALCSAEMATVEGWEESGIFGWVANTLGRKWGFAAIFFQWFQITVCFVNMLYFILSAFTYALDINFINHNPLYKFIAIMIIFWILTLSQMKGTKWTEVFGKIGFIAGIILPAVILFGLSLIYIIQGNPLQISFSPRAIIPDFSQPATLVVFVSFILSYAGVEASASYANELNDPNKDYPRVMIIVVIAAIILNAIGGLSIAAVIPKSELSMSGGIIQALASLLSHFGNNTKWIVKILALMVSLGVVGEISGWIVGPARGLYLAAQHGILPKRYKKVNKYNVPVSLVITQGIIVTIWAAVLTFIGGGNNSAFLAAISLTVLIYLVAYFLLFASYFVLIRKHKELKRAYQIKGGQKVKYLVACCGMIISILAFVISFIPPSSVSKADVFNYLMILIIGFGFSVCLPFIIYAFRDKNAKKPAKKPRHFISSEVNKFIFPKARGEHHIDPEEEDYFGFKNK